MDTWKNKLKQDTKNSVEFVNVGDGMEGIPIRCFNTKCIFEIQVYKFCGDVIENNDPPLHPPNISTGKPSMSLMITADIQ